MHVLKVPLRVLPRGAADRILWLLTRLHDVHVVTLDEELVLHVVSRHEFTEEDILGLLQGYIELPEA